MFRRRIAVYTTAHCHMSVPRHCSTGPLHLTIGDITVSVPTRVAHPERVGWALPGADLSYPLDADPLDPLKDPSTLLDELPSMHGGCAFFQLQDPTTRGYLRWICQKERLRQDMCLIGEPGPAMRWLVRMYSYLVRREVQFLALNRDTTESDLGQRREMRNGTLIYDDQCVVVAAREGQLLLLEGLERAERNVLPVINNLLENREMPLEDGSMLIHPDRYDRLLQERLNGRRETRRQSHTETYAAQLAVAHEELRRMGFIRVSENFRVIGITVPVPPFDGNPLDPPLRSRFQCLYVNVPLHTGALNTTAKSSSSLSSSSLRAFSMSSARAESLLRLRTAIDEVNASTRSFEADRANQNAGHTASGTGSNSSGNSHIRSAGGLPTIGSYELAVLERQLRLFRDIPVGDVLTRSFPWHILAQQTVASGGAAHVEEATRRRKDYERLLSACNITLPFFEKQKQLREQEAAAAAAAEARERQWGSCEKRSQNADPQPEQFNYIEAFQDVRNHGPSGGVIADARIASLSGPYTLPIHLGAAALSLPLSELSPSGSAVMRSCPTPAHLHTLQLMLQLHIAGQHILLLGPAGCGKTTLVHAFARALGQRTESMYLYADMTHKDLFQRRAMDGPSGDTAWRNSALVDAAVTGHIAVLDGVDKVPAGMLASLQQLLIDGCATLCDGTVLVPRREYEHIRARLGASDEVMRQRRVLPVHPAFRVIATARPPENTAQSSPRGQSTRWRLSHDATSLFGIVTMPDATSETLRAVMDRVASAAAAATDSVGGSERLLALRDALSELRRAEPKVPQLSLRQLLHLVRLHERYPDDFAPGVESALLLPLMPARTAALVRQVMREKGLDDTHDHSQEWAEAKGGTSAETPRQLREGRRSRRHEVLEEVSNEREGTRVFALHGEPIIRFTRVYTERERSLVPYVTRFHTNPVHESIIAWLAKQYALGSNILLIGNQGVGKNKVVDAFLARIRVPRQYIQLHRDTTVSSLTINPIVEGGRVMWEDSPLVKAVQLGHCLVVDEIDKAPVEVVQVLKGLIEDHEMRLRDGRQIRGPKAYAMLCSSTHSNNNNNNNKNSIHRMDNQRSMSGQRDNINNSNTTITTTNNKNDGNRTFPHHEIEEGQVIQMHPDFRIIVLANPPGYPFHGNDFYRECGDLFASYVMGNPDSLSQLQVLRAYGPGVPDAILVRLISAFESFQRSFEEGHLTYPFSLRELIAVVRHIAAFPQDGIYEALNNVFNFDARDENTLQLVRRVLHLHLSPLVSGGGVRRLLPLRIGHPLPLQVLPQPLSVPTTSVLVLTARIVSPDENQPYPPVVQAVPTWREIYSEADFASCRESGDSRDNVAAFTEWSATICLPFLRPGDKLLAVAASAAADHETGLPATLAALFARPTEGEEKCDQFMFAVVAPPSVRAIGIGAPASSCGPPPGTAQLYDLTGLLSPRCRDSGAGGAEKWSLELSAVSLEAHASVKGSVDAEEAQFFAVVDATTGVAVLVNPSASVREIEEKTNAQVREHVEEEPEKMDGSKGPAGGVLLLRVAPPVTDSHAEAALAVRPESGTIAMARDADVFLWIDDHHVVVTMPSPVVQLHFFTANLASVQMSSGACGVLKVTIAPGGIVHASFCPLPEAVAGTVVDIVPMNTRDNASEGSEPQANDHSYVKDSSEADRSAPLTPSALEGAVVVPSGPAARGDVAYMTFDTYASESKSWTVRVFTDATAAAAARSGVLRVDTARHQLVMTAASHGDASMNHKSSSGPTQSVVAVDTRRHTMRRFGPMPLSTSPAPSSSSSSSSSSSPLLSHEGPKDSSHFALSALAGALLRYGTVSQRLDVADVSAERVEQRYHRWSSLLEGSAQHVGTAAPRSPQRDVPMGYSRPRKNPSGTLKHGKEDGKEHHGGNTYAGGTGGTDTAGLGGLVGPYRLDKGFPVHQVSPEDKRKVPPHILEEARRMGREALAERLKEIGMSAKEYEQYRSMQERVRGPVGLLRSVLGGLKAAEGERTWMRGQTDGIWDDSKIVEGTVGERNIYKRRVDSTETNPFQAKYKKRLLFVLDVSASMYRFEGMDHRLSKLLESTVMVMEAFAGFEEKIDYSLVGHNGDNACIQLVPFGQPPTNQKARMEICQRMVAYSQYCWSGDNTVEAMRHSVDLVTAEKGDAYLVFVISDANLHRYGIEPRDLREIMLSHKEVQMFCIFIATIGEQASNLQAELPTGHGFECMQTDALPHILKQIFMSVNLF